LNEKDKTIDHDGLRCWGYRRQYFSALEGGSSNDGSGKKETQRVVLSDKCFDAFAFPSDYFPLRLLHSLESVLNGVEVEPKSGSSGEEPLVVLAARKMTCLYKILQNAGLRAYKDKTGTAGEDGRAEILAMSDRFIFLKPNLDHLKNRKIWLIDDLARQGEQLARRKENFKKHGTYRREHAGGKEGADGEGEISVNARALIDVRHSNIDAEQFRLIGGDDGAGMIRAYARTFAKNLMPYFTDFPVTRPFGMNENDFVRFMEGFGDPIFEVSSSVGIDEGLRCYTIDLARYLDGENGVRDASAFCHIIKLRIFAQTCDTNCDKTCDMGGHEACKTGRDKNFKVRLLAKPVLKKIKAFELKRFAEDHGLLDENSDPTPHQLGQVFGLLEYLVSWWLIDVTKNKLKREGFIGDNIVIGVDDDFGRLVLGEHLFNKVQSTKNGAKEDADEWKEVRDFLKGVHGGTDSGRSHRDNGFRSRRYILGDNIVQQIDEIVSKYTRLKRNEVSARQKSDNEGEGDNEWLRLSFDKLVDKVEEAFNKSKDGEGYSGLRSDLELIVGMALDTLTDWGKVVPDQQAVHGNQVLPRNDRERIRNDHEVEIERCFRAGEITALVKTRTLTGGSLSTVSESYRISADDASSNGTSDKGWARIFRAYEDPSAERTKSSSKDPIDPQKVCRDMLKVVDLLPKALKRPKIAEDRGSCADRDGNDEGAARAGRGSELDKLRDAVNGLHHSYKHVVCPLTAQAETPDEVEYASDLLKYFYQSLDFSNETEMLHAESESWNEHRDVWKNNEMPWSFGVFRRMRRAVLALDTLLALLIPLLVPSESGASAAADDLRIIDNNLTYERNKHKVVKSSDVWDDWVERLSNPPAPLAFMKEDVLDNNRSMPPIGVLLEDLLGDLWQSLTRMMEPLVFELSTEKPFLSHKIRLKKSIENVRRAAQKRLKMEHHSAYSLLRGRECEFSPFNGGDVLLTAEQVEQRHWVFKSNDIWYRFGESDLEHLVDAGKLIEVIDWQGVKRYPSFQFVRYCLREGIWRTRDDNLLEPGVAKGREAVRLTDPDYPFLRRDISEAMSGSSLDVAGWQAALWFRSKLHDLGQLESNSSGKTPNQRYPLRYNGLIFEEALAQKGLWIDHWLSDGRHLFRSRKNEDFLNNQMRTLVERGKREVYFRITEASYKHPDWWASSAPFEDSLKLLPGYRRRRLEERRLAAEPKFPASRFDPGVKDADDDKYFGALYLANTVGGCVREVFDRCLTIHLNDVISKVIYVYTMRGDDRIECYDLSNWPAVLAATPLRSSTQAIANWICYDAHSRPNDRKEKPEPIRYPLRTGMSDYGLVIFDRTYFESGDGTGGGDSLGGKRELRRAGDDATSINETANHEPDNRLARDKTPYKWYDTSWCAHVYWEELSEMGQSPRNSVVCFRRFPNPDMEEPGVM